MGKFLREKQHFRLKWHIKLCKIAIFKLRFQANYWMNQLKTNVSNSGRTWCFWGVSTTCKLFISEAPSWTNLKSKDSHILKLHLSSLKIVVNNSPIFDEFLPVWQCQWHFWYLPGRIWVPVGSLSFPPSTMIPTTADRQRLSGRQPPTSQKHSIWQTGGLGTSCTENPTGT